VHERRHGDGAGSHASRHAGEGGGDGRRTGDSRYYALTTYRRDGRPVTTPVWAAALGGRLYVFTAGSTGKAKRVRATGRVRFAPSSMNGRRLLGEWREATGRLVGDAALRDRAMAALERKYGWQLSLAMLVYRLRGLHRDRVVLELTPVSDQA
jgi:PPOX class probable F420-dependent enzyme